MANASRVILGLMSGTSADGVDAAAVRVHGVGRDMTADLLVHRHVPYPDDLRRRLFTMRGAGHAHFAELADVGRRLTLLHADAAKAAMDAADLQPSDVAAIAAHGQTLYHAPPDTIQWFDPALLAWETNCQVVSDFRRADCAAGGQGAPLVPFADWLLFRHPTKHRVLLNLGGIANLTYLPAGCELEDVVAFDCGPANCVLDWICRDARLQTGFDEGGRLAAEGTTLHAVYTGLFNDQDPATAEWRAFVSAPLPKSTDIPAMLRAWQTAESGFSGLAGPAAMRTSDRLRTAVTWIAGTFMHAVSQYVRLPADAEGEVIITGGGAFNQTLVDEIKSQLAWLAGPRQSSLSLHIPRQHWHLRQQDARGVPPDAKEALAFALLGAATLDGEPSNVPSATGASRAVVLGSVTPKPI